MEEASFKIMSIPSVVSSVKISAIRECGEKGTLVHCWWEYKLVQPLWKSVEVLQKIENRTTP